MQSTRSAAGKFVRAKASSASLSIAGTDTGVSALGHDVQRLLLQGVEGTGWRSNTHPSTLRSANGSEYAEPTLKLTPAMPPPSLPRLATPVAPADAGRSRAHAMAFSSSSTPTMLKPYRLARSLVATPSPHPTSTNLPGMHSMSQVT